MLLVDKNIIMNQTNISQTILDSQEKVWQCSPFVAKHCQQLNWLYPHVTAQLGTPYYKDIPMSMTILALAKLGGQELNFSSDIDLIFAYHEAGETVGVKRARSHQECLAYSMGYSTWSEFLTQLQHHQQNVQAIFTEVIAPEAPKAETIDHWQLINQLDQAELITKQLKQLLNSSRINKLSKNGRDKVDVLIPLLIAAAVEQDNKYEAIDRALKFLEAVAQRTVYLSLLIERPQVLKKLIHFCAESAWITEQITRYPILLDELLDERNFNPDKFEIHLPADDLEMQMDTLRQFKRANVLHIAAAELSVEVTSDYLTKLAETLVQNSLKIAKDYLHKKYGELTGFCVIAYGKAGGKELSYGSDLDLVFLYDDKNESMFFLRLAQRLIHIISTNTPAGILYEIDSRLRPNGASGLLVHSLKGFERYQQEDAWIWEHQALVRARAIAGDAETMAEFEQIRRKILSQSRDIEKLKPAIIEMRDKMRQQQKRQTI
jgi:glutamate-ammonia-ligase adenylyltransferase